jgi:hypothetical protein
MLRTMRDIGGVLLQRIVLLHGARLIHRIAAD